MQEGKKEIVKLINQLSGRWSPYQIFTDWVECTALAIQNRCNLFHGSLWQKREQQYINIMKKYDSDEFQKFQEMTFLLPFAMETLSDVLGEIYMESRCGNKNTGQFFTPFNVSQAVAGLSVPPNIDELEVIRVSEPSCGAGGMIIAFAAELLKRDINYQRRMKVVAQDLDWKAVYMTYVQLSLYGIDAVVVQGDTLADPYCDNYPPERTFRTPKNMGMLI